jgi:uncharacterized protein
MRVWAISDLHLSGAKPKPMDIFGKNWKDHPEKIARSWRERVAPDDLVLCPGDISWAMTLEEAAPDLSYLEGLPGRKILLRGNHDYWWKRKALGQVKKVLPPSLSLLQGNAFSPGGDLVIVGARLWRFPGERTVGDLAPEEAAEAALEARAKPANAGGASAYGEQRRSGRVRAPGAGDGEVQDDAKIFARELEYLKSSLREGERLGGRGKFLLAMTHYPPLPLGGGASEVSGLLAGAGVRLCIYGHLHGADVRRAPEGPRGGVEYRLSADAVDFQPVRLL